MQEVFFTKGKRLMIVNGRRGRGCTSISTFAIKYITDRRNLHYFPHGSIYVDISNKLSSNGLLTNISKKLNLMNDDKTQILDNLRSK